MRLTRTLTILAAVVAPLLAVDSINPPAVTAGIGPVGIILSSPPSDSFVEGETFEVIPVNGGAAVPVESEFRPPHDFRITLPASLLTQPGTLMIVEIDTDDTHYDGEPYIVNPRPMITTTSYPAATQGQAYSHQTTKTGGTEPFT